MTSLLESALKKRPFLNRTEGPFDRGRIGVIVRFPLKARPARRKNQQSDALAARERPKGRPASNRGETDKQDFAMEPVVPLPDQD